MATAVIHVAKALRLDVVAEGVETSEQASRLRLLGYRNGWGMFLGC
ncbi:EAL domain-containing protein [Planosporangium flavigriseum]|nr:EAL domain-containing protein [Planosporangium flavigriseum]NJC62996.1 EAL domain-containing protein [Planosporangium flavigriseum]